MSVIRQVYPVFTPIEKHGDLWKNKDVKIFLISLFFSPILMASLSYGDASDGDCSWNASDNNITQSLWNCQDINIPSGVVLKFTGTDPVVLRAQGSVNIAGTIDVSADGTSPGPGGGAPGLASGADAPGSTGGEGLGGANGTFAGDYGSGGTGATLINPTSDFPTEVLGGRGGGSGGEGNDFVDGPIAGGDGGAGGGSLSIIAKGSVLVTSDADLLAGGAQGSDGVNGVGGISGGAGGGGAGGAVYIISNNAIDFDGSIDASGGALNNGAGGPTPGTAGVSGRIRFDAPDGQRNIGGSTGGITPSEQVPPSVNDPLPGDDTSSGDDVRSLSPELESDIEYACSYREGLPYLPQLALFFFGFVFTLLMAQALRRR